MRSCKSPSARARRSARRSRATPAPTCGSCGRCRPARGCCATGCGRSSVPTTPGPGSPCRWSRSPSRSCAMRSTSTAGWPASPRTSHCGTGCCSCWRWRGSRQSEPPLPSASPRWPVVRRAGRPFFPYGTLVRVSLSVSVVVVAVLFGWGAWQRRWIADDGLIVLRTVRNLLAGNGPVFNQGERVEANTSTAWTYLMYDGSWVGGPMRMEYVALALALGLSVLGVALLMLGTGRLYAPSLRGARAIMLPAGALVYIALPPSRDFATSGLESGLAVAYLGLLWWMMVCWAQPLRTRPDNRVFIGALAFVAGFSVLVRPDLALMSGLALIMMLIAARDWRSRVLIVVAGGFLPVAYEIFRMGYYGLLVPGTALAKDAAGDKWSQGMIYLSNFDAPYAVWVPVVLLVPLGVLLIVARRRPSFVRPALAPDYGRVARAVQSPPAVVAFVLVSGLLQGLYWIRQGGDFMHARVLLAPLFCLLAPIAVIPVAIPDGKDYSRETGYWVAGTASLVWLGVRGG